MDIVLAYIQGIIETMGLVLLVLVFSRVDIKWGRTITAAIVITAVALIIRALPIVFGMHLAVSIILIFLFVINVTKAPKSLVFISVFASFFCLAAAEYSLNHIFISLGILRIEDVAEASNIWMIMGYIQAILLNILAVLLQLILKPKHSWKKKADAYEGNDPVILKSEDQ